MSLIIKEKLRHAIVSNVQFENGTETELVTIFNNNDLNFEEMNIGLNTALQRISKFYKPVKSVNSSYGSIENGAYKKCAEFMSVKIKNN